MHPHRLFVCHRRQFQSLRADAVAREAYQKTVAEYAQGATVRGSPGPAKRVALPPPSPPPPSHAAGNTAALAASVSELRARAADGQAQHVAVRAAEQAVEAATEAQARSHLAEITALTDRFNHESEAQLRGLRVRLEADRRAEVAALNETVAALRASLVERDALIAHLESLRGVHSGGPGGAAAIAALESELAQARSTIQTERAFWEARSVEHTATIERLQGEAVAAKTAADRVRSQKTDVMAKLESELSDAVNKLEEERRSAMFAHQDSETTIADLRATVSRLERGLTGKEQELEAAREEARLAADRLAAATQTLTETRETLDRERAEWIDAATATDQRWQAQNDKLAALARRETGRAEEALRRVQDLETEVARIESERQDDAARLRRAEAEAKRQAGRARKAESDAEEAVRVARAEAEDEVATKVMHAVAAREVELKAAAQEAARAREATAARRLEQARSEAAAERARLETDMADAQRVAAAEMAGLNALVAAERAKAAEAEARFDGQLGDMQAQLEDLLAQCTRDEEARHAHIASLQEENVRLRAVIGAGAAATGPHRSNAKLGQINHSAVEVTPQPPPPQLPPRPSTEAVQRAVNQAHRGQHSPVRSPPRQAAASPPASSEYQELVSELQNTIIGQRERISQLNHAVASSGDRQRPLSPHSPPPPPPARGAEPRSPAGTASSYSMSASPSPVQYYGSRSAAATSAGLPPLPPPRPDAPPRQRSNGGGLEPANTTAHAPPDTDAVLAVIRAEFEALRRTSNAEIQRELAESQRKIARLEAAVEGSTADNSRSDDGGASADLGSSDGARQTGQRHHQRRRRRGNTEEPARQGRNDADPNAVIDARFVSTLLDQHRRSGHANDRTRATLDAEFRAATSPPRLVHTEAGDRRRRRRRRSSAGEPHQHRSRRRQRSARSRSPDAIAPVSSQPARPWR